MGPPCFLDLRFLMECEQPPYLVRAHSRPMPYNHASTETLMLTRSTVVAMIASMTMLISASALHSLPNPCVTVTQLMFVFRGVA